MSKEHFPCFIQVSDYHEFPYVLNILRQIFKNQDINFVECPILQDICDNNCPHNDKWHTLTDDEFRAEHCDECDMLLEFSFFEEDPYWGFFFVGNEIPNIFDKNIPRISQEGVHDCKEFSED